MNADRGQIKPANRADLRAWLERFEGRDAAFALEGTTGWRFVVEELRRAGVEAHVAEPRPERCAAPSDEPRPTGPTRFTCATC